MQQRRGQANTFSNFYLQASLTVDVTMYACKVGATKASPDCERDLLEAILLGIWESSAVQEQLRDAGEAGRAILPQDVLQSICACKRGAAVQIPVPLGCIVPRLQKGTQVQRC